MEQELEIEIISDKSNYELGHGECLDGQRRKTKAFLREGVGERTNTLSVSPMLVLYFYFANRQSLDVDISYLAVKNNVKKIVVFCMFL